MRTPQKREMRLRAWVRADAETAGDARAVALAPLTPWILDDEMPPVHDRQLLQECLEEWWQYDSDLGAMIHDLIVCNNRTGIITLLRATKRVLSMCSPPINDAWVITAMNAAMEWKTRTEFGGLDTLEGNTVRLARDDAWQVRNDLRYRIAARTLSSAWESMTRGTGFGDVLLWAALAMMDSVQLLGSATAGQILRDSVPALPPIEEWLGCEFAHCYGRRDPFAVI